MLMDTGGNCGSQASVTVIRGISLDEIEFSDLLRVIWKEIRVAVLCAAVLSAANFVGLLLVDKMIFGNPITMTVAAVICLTLIVTVFAAKLVGCTLPLLAKKIGFDPAVNCHHHKNADPCWPSIPLGLAPALVSEFSGSTRISPSDDQSMPTVPRPRDRYGAIGQAKDRRRLHHCRGGEWTRPRAACSSALPPWSQSP